MDIRPKVRNTALVIALVGVTATAWGTTESMSSSSTCPPMNSVSAEEMAPLASDAALAPYSLGPNESMVTTSDTEDAVTAPVAPAPVVQNSVSQPPITVETRRLSEDERIQAQVMDKLASSEHISGKIGVEAHDSVVTLSGWTSTSGQAWRAGNAARSINGVKYVQNEIRPRVGGSV
jgi:hypothetical protein